MADVSRTPDSPRRCHCGGPEEQLYGHAYGFGRHCRDQVAAARPVVDPTRPLPGTTPDRASVSHITDDMVQRGASAVVGTIFRDDFEASHNKHIDLARAVLSAALAGCTVVAAPELIEIPTFSGCTSHNPFDCACTEGPICCAACGDPIEDGARAWSFRFIGCPWEADNSPEQDWGDVFWHEHCDNRGLAGSVSPKGDDTNG